MTLPPTDAASAPPFNQATDQAPNSIKAEEPAPQPGQASLADLRRAVDESAKQVRTSFIWFMTISMYFAVVAATTTHEQLFLGQSIKIPIIDVTLPIDAVYLVSPLVYGIIYVSLLIQTDGLERTLRLFADRLKDVSEAQRRSEATMTCDLAFVHLYLRTSDSIFVMLLTWIVFVVSFFGIPLAIMLLFQMHFLPYKHPWLTYFHMGLVVLTTTIAIYFWFRFAAALEIFPRSSVWIRSPLRLVIPAAGAILALGSTLILVPEYSWIDMKTRDSVFAMWRQSVKRSLDLRGLALGDETKVILLDGRDYSNADFGGARLTNVELINANLESTRFHRATLRKVKIACRNYDPLFEMLNVSCPIHALSMSGATLSDVRMDGLAIGYFNLNAATIINSRLTVEGLMVNLSEAKLLASTLGHSDIAAGDDADRVIEWAYFGNAALINSKIFVKRASGIHRLAFADRSTFLITEANNDEERARAGMVFSSYLGTTDLESVVRRLTLAFDPLPWAKSTLSFKTEGATKVTPSITCQKTSDEPSSSTAPPTLARDCVGLLGYDLETLGPFDFVAVLETAEQACGKARQGATLRTTVESFVSLVLSEQLAGRGLGSLRSSRFLVDPAKQQVQSSNMSKGSSAKDRFEEFKRSHAIQLDEIKKIWTAVSNSSCICEKLIPADLSEALAFDEVYERVANNLSAVDGGQQQVVRRRPVCNAAPNR
jgi:uncharacterized protein YjbI with pentapeptide repeats